jgi:hypothetical protein
MIQLHISAEGMIREMGVVQRPPVVHARRQHSSRIVFLDNFLRESARVCHAYTPATIHRQQLAFIDVSSTILGTCNSQE